MKTANYNRPARAKAPASPPAPAADAAADTDTTHRLTLTADVAGLRFDHALARALPDYSRSRLKHWIDGGRVTLDGRPADPKRKVWGGEEVVVQAVPDPRETAFVPEAIALAILYEDATLLVIDKPAGLVMHPGSGNWQGTLLNALLHYAPGQATIPRAGIVHRLDKDTSGLIVVAKTLAAQTDLVRQLQARTVTREYLALAAGDIARGGTVDAPIGRHPARRTTMAIVATGRPARTHYAVVERFGRATLLRCRLDTGRTHQIRVHLASLGHPLVGDPAYGRKGPVAFGRQALHALRLGLLHPVTHRQCAWESPLPEDFAALLAALRSRAEPR